jgi:very-short-patch-repair endonuclease
MQVAPIDFFATHDNPLFGWYDVFDAQLVNAIANGPIEQADDLEVAQELARVVHEELKASGTGSNPKINDREIAQALKALRAVLQRLGIAFKPPFRDFIGFRDYWVRQGMGGQGGYAKRREYLGELFEPVLNTLDQLETSYNASRSVRGVGGQLKNIIFASSGPKPEIVLTDAVNNLIEITKNREYCLVYDRPLTQAGLTWKDLVAWWRSQREGVSGPTVSDLEMAKDLYRRLEESLGDNEVERLVLRTYCERYRREGGFENPALLPQVYLHFDPLTSRQRQALGRPDYLGRERMDFLLLLTNNVRIVIEVDGKQHYSDGNTPSPERYAKMVAEDRALRLRGYEVFRFGGYELMQPDAAAMLRTFFENLYAVHGITG